MQTENNAGAKVIGVMALLVAAWGVYQVLKGAEGSKKSLEGGKSESATKVLQLMDEYDEPNYSKAFKTVFHEKTKGMSLNKAKQFRKKLSNELKYYI